MKGQFLPNLKNAAASNIFIYLFVSFFVSCLLSNYTFMKSCPTCLQLTHTLTSICIAYCCPRCSLYMYIYICIYISPTCTYILAPCLPFWSSILHKHTHSLLPILQLHRAPSTASHPPRIRCRKWSAEYNKKVKEWARVDDQNKDCNRQYNTTQLLLYKFPIR